LTIANDYDGFYFQPVSNDDVEISYFKYNEDKDRGEKVNGSEMGDIFQIVIWKYSDNSLPAIDDNYEAVLVDPVTYAKQLIDSSVPMYGVIVRKTSESFKFVESYINRFDQSVKKAIETLNKLKK
jgi:hypothetical protein